MNFIISAASDIGRVRNNNEDMVLVGSHFVRNSQYACKTDLTTCDRLMIALADGMGGHNGGEVASHDVLHNLQYFVSDLPAGLKPSDFNEKLFEWLGSINSIIDSKGHSDPDLLNMGTTLVAMAYFGQEFYSMNCGDSRLYQFDGTTLRQLTTDHSLSNLVGSTEHTSIITNCIGGGCKTSYMDMVRMTDSVVPGQTFFLCSDGLTDMLSDDTIAALLKEGADAPALCAAANAAGGHDNVSVCVIKVE